MGSMRTPLFAIALFITVALPIGAAVLSPLHAWRDSIYIGATFAGIIGLALMLFQPLLIANYIPGLSAKRGRSVHQWLGSTLALLVVLHVVGLWITSPPDVIDALLFVSATPFSSWGVVAMWAVLISSTATVFRHSLSLKAHTWRLVHRCLAIVIVVGTVVHAMLVDGAMETFSKAFLCFAVLVAALKVLTKLRWRKR